MGFRYTAPPLTQGLGSLAVIGAFVGLITLPGAQARWGLWLQSTPAWVHFPLAILVLHGVVYWGISAICWRAERTGKPTWIARHRIQSGPVRQPPASKVAKTLALNQLVLTPLLLAALWGVLWLRGWEIDLTLPRPVEVLGHLAGLTVAAALWFYASHRFLHRPWWMKRVHRIHHEFRTSSAWAAEYAHPFEMVVANFGTLAIGVVLFAPNLATIYLYTVVGTLTFVGHHSGFAVRWLSWAIPHDWHHYKYTEAFGTFGVLDRLLGTDRALRELQDGDQVD